MRWGSFRTSSESWPLKGFLRPPEFIHFNVFLVYFFFGAYSLSSHWVSCQLLAVFVLLTPASMLVVLSDGPSVSVQLYFLSIKFLSFKSKKKKSIYYFYLALRKWRDQKCYTCYVLNGFITCLSTFHIRSNVSIFYFWFNTCYVLLSRFVTGLSTFLIQSKVSTFDIWFNYKIAANIGGI